ncbi:MAG TPA: SPOR domain-containing protein [Roseiarcus sp.]|nr:SPOR domain-containing protein [Roseiarcus sp.]
MSGSGPRFPDEINLDEFERRLRAAGGGQARAEDPLAELARLVEFAHLGISNDEAVPTPRPAIAAQSADAAAPLEKDALRPTIEEEVEDIAPGASEAEREARQDYAFDAPAAGLAEARRPLRWKVAASALAVAGVAMIGAVFALRSGAPGFSKDPPFIAAAQGPTKVAPPSDQTAAASSDAGASLLNNNNVKPGGVKLVNSEEQPVDLSAQASLDNPPPANPPPANPLPATPNPPAAADQAAPPPPGSAADTASLAAIANTPLVAPPAPQPPAVTSEFPAPKPVRTVSLRPDGTPIGAVNPPDQPASDAKPVSPPAEAPANPAPKTAADAAGAAQPSTPKLDLPARASTKSSARVAVGKTDTTAPVANAETPREPPQNGGSAKPERAAKKPKAREVADATETTGAIAEPPVDATAATASGGWAVQLAAPRSEAEANSELARLTAKYGAELNGSPIGVHKATVKGETIYRLRVVGLTKADAAKLCARLKGEGAQCFIAK